MKYKRNDEPQYACLSSQSDKTTNVYGLSIETIVADSPLKDEHFEINHQRSETDNANRYKQHGFYFNADNCIACHACEAA